ncbi:MAG: DNA polymerase III subunit gamma/tau [Gammaproteobacteria bacterium PRO9]|nr:DNA polymerase III subunit gamma/tau [Gammaproteobacteria bacterium PRO9]
MTYLALARKWRPKTFADVAGQGHVVRALENALNSGKLHHAFLFTGTRGVGKTTIARIFVKALNCERGVSATPCGECASCLAIDQGRFVDFLEVDAASHTGVDNAREMLENAQYTPAAGRFKVYLIDEVHMLSKAAFNALLKTLEEPPPHVKFLLATTDPQKIPVTVLSRCLQFNLKRLPLAVIAERLALVCQQESIAAEASAIQRLARAAAGSMRDALSLLDQALAFGADTLKDADVAEMLGSLDASRLAGLLEALAAGDAPALMAQIRQLDELAPDYADVLAGLATRLQQIAVRQLAGPEAFADGADELAGEDDRVLRDTLAERLDPETVQLMYQIAIQGRRDLNLAPDPRTGAEMTLLRMVAFRPGAGDERPGQGSRQPAASGSAVPRSAAPNPAPVKPATPARREADLADWPAFVATLNLDGAARQLASHCVLAGHTATEVRLALDERSSHLLTDNLRQRLAAAIAASLGREVKLLIAVGAVDKPTLAARQARAEDADLEQARAQIAADQNVQQLTELFGAEVIPDSIRRSPPSKSRK